MKLLWRAAFICALGIGLVSVFQNCSPVQFQNAPFEQNSQLTTSNCTPNDSISCRIPNGEGTSRCNLEGNGWSSCELTRCDHGYSAQNGQCIRTPCNNGAVNPPQCNQCASGNILNNQGQCVARICSPGTTRGCVIPNGQGQETCNSQGTGWGACQIISCNSNYVQQGNQCVTATCSNGASNPPQCTQCSVGQSMVNGRCQAHVCSPNSSRDCSVANGQGRQVCRSDGSGWDSCQVTNCNAGYSNQNNVCVVSTCSNGANNPPACTTCPSGQSLINGQCRTLVCTPNSSQSCTIPNGQGQQQCNSQGTGWNTCQVVSCNTGYQLVGNSCAPEPTVTIITGTAYCVEYWNGTMWTCGDNRIGSSNNRESWVYIGSAGPGYSSRTPGGCEPGHTQRKQLRNVNGALIGFTCERDFPQSQVPSNRISGVAYCDPNKFKGWGGQDCGTYGSNFNPTTSTWQAYLAANPAGPLNPVCTDGATPIGILYSVNQQGQTGGISGFACVRGSLPVHNHWQPGPISSPSSGSTGGSGSGGSSPSAQPSNACQLNFITLIGPIIRKPLNRIW